MVEQKRYDVSVNEMILVQFELVLLEKTAECKVSSNSRLKCVLDFLKSCFHEEMVWYDFSNVLIMDPVNEKYLKLSKSLKENGCFSGCKLLVI